MLMKIKAGEVRLGASFQYAGRMMRMATEDEAHRHLARQEAIASTRLGLPECLCYCGDNVPARILADEPVWIQLARKKGRR